MRTKLSDYGNGDSCEPTRQLRLVHLGHGSPPVGPVDITRHRRLANCHDLQLRTNPHHKPRRIAQE